MPTEDLLLEKIRELKTWLIEVEKIMPQQEELFVQLSLIAFEMGNFALLCGKYFMDKKHAHY